MSEFLTDPSVLTKDKLKSALVANNVALPNGDQRKGVYVELYLKNLTSQNKKNTSPDTFSSDEELGPMVANKSRSGRKATKKTDRVPPEEIDVVELTDECLKDQLLKYGVNAGPIVASTRKLYEKRLQKLLEAGVPEALVPSSEHVHAGRSHNGTTHADQYSDVEGETTTIPEPEPEPEPVPVVERPVRSRGKLSVTPRTLSSQHRTEENNEPDGELQVWNIRRKSRRSSRRLDQAVPASDDTDFSELSAAETLPPPCERKTTRPLAIPRDPIPLLADKPSGFSPASGPSFPESPTVPVYSALDGCRENFLAEEDTHTDTHTLSSRALKTGPVDINPKRVLLTKRHRSASTPLSRELVHTMCRLSPHPASPHSLSVMDSSAQPLSPQPLMDSSSLPARDVPLPITKSLSKEYTGSSMAQSRGRQTDPGPLPSPVTPVRGQDFSCGEQSLGVLIERLSYVEQTPKTAERNVLKEMFPNENLSTPTGISATCRPPIKGAAGRSLSDAWLDELRPRLTELRQTSSSYTESSVGRSAPRVSAVPFPASRPTAPSAVQAKARRRIPVWVRLLLLGAVVVFLFLVYQAMETNEMSPFGQGASSALDSTSK